MLENDIENRNYDCNCQCENMNMEIENCDCKNDLREEMMMNLKAYKFSVIELALYLDTHPDDEKALYLHKEYSKKVKDLEEKYQKMFGPLSIYYPCKKWRWLEGPWPWERGNK